MSAERPWLKFYPQDWRADERLRNCSLATRGLWIELIAIMHRSERYGYLLINGKEPSERALAIQVGGTIDEVKSGLEELEGEGVFSRDRNGLIYSRRMIRDEKRAEHARKTGRKGGNPKLGKHEEKSSQDKGADKQAVNGGDKPQIPDARGQTNSVDKSTGTVGADPDGEFDPVKALFDDGVKLLTAAGTSERSARSLIGRWRNQVGDDEVALGFVAAEAENLSQPVEWLMKRFAARAKRQESEQSRRGAPSGDLVQQILEEDRRKKALAK